jgi:hypothetical protein
MAGFHPTKPGSASSVARANSAAPSAVVRARRTTADDADRAQQKALLVALIAWPRALRRDECGAWYIRGKRGSIYTWGDGVTWVLYVSCRSERHWAATKQRLGFCELILDGSGEGCLRLHRLPTSEQAAVIRDVLGIRKRMEFAPADLERRRTSMSRLSPAPGSENTSELVRSSVSDTAPISAPKVGV